MLTGLQELLRPDLEIVKSYVQKEFLLHAGPITRFIKLEAHKPDKELFPALLLTFNKLFNKLDNKSYAMAAVLEFICLASQTHEEDRDNIAYEVLIGDYFYAKFFSYLCYYDALEWLFPLSELICQIQEANILKLEKPKPGNNLDKLIEIIDKEKAAFCSESCYIGAKLGGASQEMLDAARVFGLHLGRCWNLSNYPEGLELAKQNLSAAKKALFLLPNAEGFKMLAHLLDSIEMRLSTKQVNKAV